MSRSTLTAGLAVMAAFAAAPAARATESAVSVQSAAGSPAAGTPGAPDFRPSAIQSRSTPTAPTSAAPSTRTRPGQCGQDGVRSTGTACRTRSPRPTRFPPDCFNTRSPRGAVFATTGWSVQVSANAGVGPIEFDLGTATCGASARSAPSGCSRRWARTSPKCGSSSRAARAARP